MVRQTSAKTAIAERFGIKNSVATDSLKTIPLLTQLQFKCRYRGMGV